VAWAGSQGGDTGKLGIIGFCRGGRTVWEYAAHRGSLKAGVAFYGPPVDPANRPWPKSPMQLAPEMKAPVLGLYGGADTGIPVAQVEQLKTALEQNKKTAEFQDLSGSAAWLPCRLPRQLSQGRSRRCLEAGPGLVQEVWRVELTLDHDPPSPACHNASRAWR
jgi:dienelactone hydrolase